MGNPPTDPAAPARERGEGFTATLWRQIVQAYGAILEHPFIEGLTSGRLDRQAFRFYVIQDSHYLRDFARTLSVAAAKAPEGRWIATFNAHARGALEVEHSLHESFFAEFGMDREEVAAVPMAPTCRAYCSYLLATAYAAPFHEVLAAVLPCYWIYWEVGKALVARGSPEPLYQRWIDTYGGEEYAGVVREVLDLADVVAEPLNEAARAAMGDHFLTTSRYEWMFWEMGYRQESWPV